MVISSMHRFIYFYAHDVIFVLYVINVIQISLVDMYYFIKSLYESIPFTGTAMYFFEYLWPHFTQARDFVGATRLKQYNI